MAVFWVKQVIFLHPAPLHPHIYSNGHICLGNIRGFNIVFRGIQLLLCVNCIICFCSLYLSPVSINVGPLLPVGFALFFFSLVYYHICLFVLNWLCSLICWKWWSCLSSMLVTCLDSFCVIFLTRFSVS